MNKCEECQSYIINRRMGECCCDWNEEEWFMQDWEMDEETEEFIEECPCFRYKFKYIPPRRDI